MGKEAIPPGSIVSKDAKMGISRATSLFILYIGQAAMEIANDNKRKTVKESDVLKALEGKEMRVFTIVISPELRTEILFIIAYQNFVSKVRLVFQNEITD